MFSRFLDDPVNLIRFAPRSNFSYAVGILLSVADPVYLRGKQKVHQKHFSLISFCQSDLKSHFVISFVIKNIKEMKI